MKHAALALVLVILGLSAWGGEVYVGTISSFDGGVSDNRYLPDGGFAIGAGNSMEISVQCASTVAVYVCTDVARAGCTTSTGALLSPGELRRTSLKRSTVALAPVLSDGGFVAVAGGVVSILPVGGATAATCKVFGRSGRE